MNSIIDLVLTYHFFDMIDKGDKREEYRQIKPYWVKRLIPCTHECSNGHWSDKYLKCVYTCKAVHAHMNFYSRGLRIGPFGYVCFHRGYSKKTMLWSISDISIGKGKKEWGAPDEPVIIIKLGNRYESRST